MEVKKNIQDGVLTLAVAGRLDTNTAPDLEAALAGEKPTAIVFDCEALEYVSSAGLRVMMSAHKMVMATGGAVTIAKPNKTVRNVLDMTGLSGIFNITD